jgi:hypothetical protein
MGVPSLEKLLFLPKTGLQQFSVRIDEVEEYSKAIGFQMILLPTCNHLSFQKKLLKTDVFI